MNKTATTSSYNGMFGTWVVGTRVPSSISVSCINSHLPQTTSRCTLLVESRYFVYSLQILND